MSELRAWTITSVAGVIWAALTIATAATGNLAQVWTIADVVPFLLIGVGLFEKWGWRLWFLPRVIGVPVLRGTWRGELESLWQDPASGQRLPKKPVYLAVDQTMTSVCVRLLSDESTSEQVAGSLMRPHSGPRVLSAVYVNTPTVGRRDSSPIHHGALLLRLGGAFPAKRLEGEYWTDRQSKGAIILDAHTSKLADSYADAERLTFR